MKRLQGWSRFGSTFFLSGVIHNCIQSYLNGIPLLEEYQKLLRMLGTFNQHLPMILSNNYWWQITLETCQNIQMVAFTRIIAGISVEDHLNPVPWNQVPNGHRYMTEHSNHQNIPHFMPEVSFINTYYVYLLSTFRIEETNNSTPAKCLLLDLSYWTTHNLLHEIISLHRKQLSHDMLKEDINRYRTGAEHTTKHLHSGTFVLNCVMFMFRSGNLSNGCFFPQLLFTPKRGQVMSTCFAVCEQWLEKQKSIQ